MAGADQDRRRLRRASRRPGRPTRHAVLRLLPDTHVVLWWMAGEVDRLSDTARVAIADSEVVVSAVVIWEVAIKRRLGKLDAPSDLLDRLEQAGVDLLPITARHADRVGELPLHHRDPFDRLLIAQADSPDLALVSADEQLKQYEVKVIW